MDQVYPKWLYHATQPAALVNDAQAHQDLGAGWYESPGEAAAAPAAATTPAAATSPNSDPALDAEKKALWGNSVAVLITKLGGASKATLEKIKAYEGENPKGPRKSLVDAVDAAIAAVQE